MGLFGETANERKLRQVQEDVEGLRQQLGTAKKEADSLRQDIDGLSCKLRNYKELLNDTMSGLARMREKHHNLMTSFLNFVARAKRKRLQAKHATK